MGAPDFEIMISHYVWSSLIFVVGVHNGQPRMLLYHCFVEGSLEGSSWGQQSGRNVHQTGINQV